MAAGLDAIRTNSVDRAVVIVRSIVLEGLIIAVDGSVDGDESVCPSIDLLHQLPQESACPIVLVVRGPLTAAEERSASRTNAAVIDAKRLTHRGELERLVRHITATNE